jgi:CheY-like chemotaxis protein
LLALQETGRDIPFIVVSGTLGEEHAVEAMRQERKENEALRAIPIVVLTSSREDRDLGESYRRRVNAYVVKPVDFHAFADAVRTLGLD